MQVVLPGDAIPVQQPIASLRIGPGVKEDDTKISATRAGLLGHVTKKQKHDESVWVEGTSRRYIPAVGEPVIGVVVARHAEGYRVDLGSSQMAALDALAFEGATKRSKPNLKIGAVVYARVSLALPFAEPEIECVNPTTQKAESFGELTGGMLLRDIELSRCRRLLTGEDETLTKLGSKKAYEVAVGVNGRIWVKTAGVEKTLEVLRAIGKRLIGRAASLEKPIRGPGSELPRAFDLR